MFSDRAQGRYIVQVGVADSGLAVPGVHGVQRLREFGAACAIDATSVDPKPVEPVGFGEDATVAHLCARVVSRNAGGGISECLQLLERQLAVLPDVREDCVAPVHIPRAIEVFEPASTRSNEPHRC